MDLFQEYNAAMTRRHLFKRGALGLGTAALATLMPDRLLAVPEKRRASGGLPGLPHFAAKAKRAIYLFMNGGPAQMDLFDYKPRMDSYFDRDLPNSIRRGQRLTTMSSGQPRFPIAPSNPPWQGRNPCQRAPALDRAHGGRSVRHQDDAHRGDQSRPRGNVHLHGQPDPRTGQPGKLAQLRPGQRQPQPARLRRDDAELDARQRSGPLPKTVGLRFPSRATFGSVFALAGGSGAVSAQSARRGCANAPPHARRPGPAQSAPARRSRRSRHAHAHRAI